MPHLFYSDIIEQAILNSIPVFKEKPLALNLDEAQKINKLALKKNVQVYTITKRQFYPSYSKGLEFLKNGEIGIPYMYNARHYFPNGSLYKGWRSTTRTSGGGIFMDMEYHLLGILQIYFGNIDKIHLYGSNIAKQNYKYDVGDAASLHNLHSNGVHGVFQLAGLSGPKEEEIEIRGTKGRMKIGKSNIKTYDNQGNLKKTLNFKINSITAVTKALKQFFLNDKSIWTKNLLHNLTLMRTINIAYKRRLL